jgi:hypothetical protein
MLAQATERRESSYAAMQQNQASPAPRRVLTRRPPAPPEVVADLLKGAIEQRLCVSATYNRTRLVLAPHQIHMKNDAPHLDAVTLDHGGRAPKNPRVGTFKIAGLTQVTVMPTSYAEG